jgi:hypothetical protein
VPRATVPNARGVQIESTIFERECSTRRICATKQRDFRCLPKKVIAKSSKRTLELSRENHLIDARDNAETSSRHMQEMQRQIGG